MKTGYPTYKESIWLLLTIIPIALLLAVPLVILHLPQNGIAISLISVLALATMIGIGLTKRKSYSFPTNRFPFSLLIISYIFLISFHFLAEPLLNLLPQPETLSKLIEELSAYPIILFLFLVVLAPVLEELLFRGIILDGYLKNYSPLMSILVSSLLFALFHGNIVQGIGALIMGVLVGILYWQIKSIVFCISLHFLNNLTALSLSWFIEPQQFDSTLQELIHHDTLYTGLYAFMFVIWTGCAWFLWNFYLKPVRHLLTQRPSQLITEAIDNPE